MVYKEVMQDKICAIDGTYELFRSYFGAAKRFAANEHSNAASFFLAQSLLKLKAENQFSHYCIAFDSVVESFRNQLFDGYKTGEGIEPNLLRQFPVIEKLCEALGIRVLSMVDFEADDALATIAHEFKESVHQIVIASPDKDLLQLVEGERIITWDRMRGIYYNEQAASEKLGVAPRSVPDYLALVGDSADGIPGIARFGKKSTSLLLKQYDCLEQIPDSADDWQVKIRGAAALAENLREGRQDAVLYKRLATLVKDVPLDLSLSDLIWQAPDWSRLESICSGQEERSFLQKMKSQEAEH